jgi:hypothetical protein
VHRPDADLPRTTRPHRPQPNTYTISITTGHTRAWANIRPAIPPS